MHPTSLDGVLHLGTAAISRGGSQLVPTTIPTLVRNLWIGSKKMSYGEDNTHVEGAAWIVSEDNRGFEVDGMVLDAGRNTVLARISGMKLTIVSDLDHLARNDAEIGSHICYNVECRTLPDMWKPGKLDLVDLVRRLGHQKPGLSILQLGGGHDDERARSILVPHKRRRE